MEPITIIFDYHPGHGWSYRSPDLQGLIGGAETYEATRTLADEGVRVHLQWQAEERGEDPAAVEIPPIEHYVPESAIHHLAGSAA
jgi:predicted RNase H-like HicB family nuclease